MNKILNFFFIILIVSFPIDAVFNQQCQICARSRVLKLQIQWPVAYILVRNKNNIVQNLRDEYIVNRRFYDEILAADRQGFFSSPRFTIHYFLAENVPPHLNRIYYPDLIENSNFFDHMNYYWPNLNFTDNHYFWASQYYKHGLCGMGQVNYFRIPISIVHQLNQVFQNIFDNYSEMTIENENSLSFKNDVQDILNQLTGRNDMIIAIRCITSLSSWDTDNIGHRPDQFQQLNGGVHSITIRISPLNFQLIPCNILTYSQEDRDLNICNLHFNPVVFSQITKENNVFYLNGKRIVSIRR